MFPYQIIAQSVSQTGYGCAHQWISSKPAPFTIADAGALEEVTRAEKNGRVVIIDKDGKMPPTREQVALIARLQQEIAEKDRRIEELTELATLPAKSTAAPGRG